MATPLETTARALEDGRMMVNLGTHANALTQKNNKDKVSFSDIVSAYKQHLPNERSKLQGLTDPFASYRPVDIPLLPHVVRGFELPELKDPFRFLEWCPVRGVGACIAGGVMGFLFGAVFSGYSSLAPYDPALRDFQIAQARAAAVQAANAAASKVAGGSTATAATAASHSAHALIPPVSINPLAPVYIPGISAPAGASAAANAAAAAEAAVRASFPEPPSLTLAQTFKEGFAQMKERSVSSARNFAVMGGIYTTLECTMESIRAKKDIYNAITAGFGTGAILAARAGPTAIIIGGAGFGMFSAIIEVASPYLFDH